MHLRRLAQVLSLAAIVMFAGVWQGATRAGETASGSEPSVSSQPVDTQDVSLDAMIGQMLMVGFQGSSPDSEWVRTLCEQVANGSAGGVFFLKRNIKSKIQTEKLTRLFANANRDLPAFISVDQEGGKVQRLSTANGFSAFPSAADVARRHSIKGAARIYRRMADQLRGAGFNLNLGPVLDMNLNRSNPVIAKLNRSYGTDPAKVAAFARSFVEAHRAAGILTAVKHYPGHGNSTKDSHLGFVDISKTWVPAEIEPYLALHRAGAVDMVMVGHLYHAEFADGERTPATLSHKAVTLRLRGDLGDDVVVITDDMEMAAIRELYTTDVAIVQAIKAGNDILLFSQTKAESRSFPERFSAIVKAAVADGRLSRERIAASYRRIVHLKLRLKGG